MRIDDAQLEWLEEDLAATQAAPPIVLMHHTASEQDLAAQSLVLWAPAPLQSWSAERFARSSRRARKVIAVFNGHLHWNHFDICGGIPYVTVQSLIENLDEDAPGRPAAAHAVCSLSDKRLIVEIAGNDPRATRSSSRRSSEERVSVN